jgi:hypothetical protein
MEWSVEFTDEFEGWWDGLSVEEQEDVGASVGLLEKYGPALKFPHSSGVASSIHPQMRELRIQHAGRPYRVLYAFDPTGRRSCYWTARRQGTTAGTKHSCHKRIAFSANTSGLSRRESE